MARLTTPNQPRARISRRKIARSPLATGPGFAWRWLYDVTGPDGADIASGVDRLATAERIARQAGFVPYRSWEVGGLSMSWEG